jgi:Reverse transcriptase (RNA-dependent DNA polymerase).
MTTIAVFLDISKAYESTWHTGFIFKLVSLNVPEDLIRAIDSFLA